MSGVEVGTAYVTVLPSTQGFHKTLAADVNQASLAAGKSGGQAAGGAFTAGFGKAAAGVGVAMAGLFSARAIASGVGSAIDAGSNLAESQSKVSVVFGESAAAIESWADTSATALLLSKQAALEAAGTYGNLFQAFGIGQKQAMEMSTTLVQLAADLASFNNTSVDEALQALRSGLSGETEPLKRYGVALTDARLKQEAMAQGIFDGVGTMNAAVKSQAAYALILKDTKLAQGDVSRTADGYANTMRAVDAAVANAQATIGTELLNALQLVSKEMGGPGGFVPLIEAAGEKGANLAAGLGIATENLIALNNATANADGDTWLSRFGTAASDATLRLLNMKWGLEKLNDVGAAARQETEQHSAVLEDARGSMSRYVSGLYDGQKAAESYTGGIANMVDYQVDAVTGLGTLKDALAAFAGKSSLRQSGVSIRDQWRALGTMGERVWQGKGKNRKQVQLAFAPGVSGGQFDTSATGDQARTWADQIAQDYLTRAQILSGQGRSDDANALIERGQSRLAKQFGKWGVNRPMNYAESFLPDIGGAPASDESRRTGTTTIYQFNGGITVDSSPALVQVSKEAQRLAATSGGRYSGMAATGKGYRP